MIVSLHPNSISAFELCGNASSIVSGFSSVVLPLLETFMLFSYTTLLFSWAVCLLFSLKTTWCAHQPNWWRMHTHDYDTDPTNNMAFGLQTVFNMELYCICRANIRFAQCSCHFDSPIRCDYIIFEWNAFNSLGVFTYCRQHAVSIVEHGQNDNPQHSTTATART